MTELNLDNAREALADNGIDGPDLPYNPRALRAMRVADALLAEVERLQADERSWADTILAQRDEAIATVARVRALLDDPPELVVPQTTLLAVAGPAIWVDDLRKALDGGGDAT